MKKFAIIFLIIAVLGASGYFGYNYVSTPNGFTSKEEVITSFIENIKQDNVCDTHFDEKTKDTCTTFVSLVKDDELAIVSTSVIGGEMNLTMTINGNQGVFVVRFVAIEETGLTARFHPEYYKISFIE